MKRDAEDARFSYAIRERDNWTCQRCFKTYPPPTRALHCAHMFSRGKLATRFDMENAVALCYGCHRWLDTHPNLKRLFFLERLGDEAFAALEARSNQTVRWDPAAEPRSWTWNSAAKRRDRNVQIMEWWELGVPREEIAGRVSLSPQRVSQIVNAFGAGWR